MKCKRLWTAAFVVGVLAFGHVSFAGDADGDGVPDSLDVCCHTEGGVTVDATGRPVADLDKDCDVDINDLSQLLLDMHGPEAPGCCSHEDCDDSSACTIDTCSIANECIHESIDCDDNDDCTSDSCEALAGCMNDPICPICTPNEVRACYSGPEGSQDVGICKEGEQVCDKGGFEWGPCAGEVLPEPEICDNGIDEDCSGEADDPPDADGDGWNYCQNDCCDTPTAGCGDNPGLVNPGAVEIVGNGLDDDCDPATSDSTVTNPCSTGVKFSAVTAMDAAQAMDLCQTTTVNAPLPSKKWGLISATQLGPDAAAPDVNGLANIQNFQTAVLVNYGTGGVVPRKNVTMAGISTGRMRDQNDSGYAAPNAGADFGRSLAFPIVNGPLGFYLSAHGGNLVPGKCGASTCTTGSGAYDGVLLRLTIRVPTNVQSLSYDFRFFSSEYQSYQCTQFNDYFLTMLTSAAPGIPSDRNITFDSQGKPVNVNSPFLQICPGNGKNCNTCSLGTASLAGTGMQESNTGGGTGWLTSTAPVVPGETITLDFLLFDVSDRILDSLILLDNFRWNVAPSNVITHAKAP
jgi:hypothetical protein